MMWLCPKVSGRTTSFNLWSHLLRPFHLCSPLLHLVPGHVQKPNHQFFKGQDYFLNFWNMDNEGDLLAQFVALYAKASSCNIAELRRLDNEKRKREGTRLECPTILRARKRVHQVYQELGKDDFLPVVSDVLHCTEFRHKFLNVKYLSSLNTILTRFLRIKTL